MVGPEGGDIRAALSQMDVSHPSDGRSSRASWCAQFFRPIRYCLRPARSGPLAADMPTSAWLCNLILALIVVAAAAAVFDAWDATVSVPATPGVGVVQVRGWTEVFMEQWGSKPIDRLGLLFIEISAIIILLVFVGAWVFLIDLYRSGPVVPVALRALRIITASGWPALILGSLIGVLFTLAEHSDRRARTAGIRTAPGLTEVVIFYALPICVGVIVSWISRATRAASRGGDTPMAPLCESCGYDLTHLPESGACTECGTAIGDSIGESALRRGIEWEADSRQPLSLAVVRSVINRPSTFYRSLQLRTGKDAALRFARLNYLLLGVFASVWIMALILSSSGRRSQNNLELALLVGVGLLFWVPIAGMLLQRLIFAIVATGWIVRGSLRDARWAIKGLYYETAFLWVFSLWTALWFTCLVNLHRHIIALQEWAFGRRIYILGMPPEAIFFLGGEVLLCLVWIWRFRQFYLAIRWNNA